jgi:hypothetical protein
MLGPRFDAAPGDEDAPPQRVVSELMLFEETTDPTIAGMMEDPATIAMFACLGPGPRPPRPPRPRPAPPRRPPFPVLSRARAPTRARAGCVQARARIARTGSLPCHRYIQLGSMDVLEMPLV